MTSDEGDRPHGLHLRSIDTRRRGWLDHAPQLRVWLPAHPQGEMSLVPTLAPTLALTVAPTLEPTVAPNLSSWRPCPITARAHLSPCRRLCQKVSRASTNPPSTPPLQPHRPAHPHPNPYPAASGQARRSLAWPLQSALTRRAASSRSSAMALTSGWATRICTSGCAQMTRRTLQSSARCRARTPKSFDLPPRLAGRRRRCNLRRARRAAPTTQSPRRARARSSRLSASQPTAAPTARPCPRCAASRGWSFAAALGWSYGDVMRALRARGSLQR